LNKFVLLEGVDIGETVVGADIGETLVDAGINGRGFAAGLDPGSLSGILFIQFQNTANIK